MSSMTNNAITNGILRCEYGRSHIAESSLVVMRYTSGYIGIPETVAELWDMCQVDYAAAETVKAIHEIRPDFKALMYRNIRAVNRNSPEAQTFVYNGWVLKNREGDYVHSSKYPDNYMVDIGNPDYRLWLANWISSKIGPFDGVMADNSLVALASELFWDASPGSPINPRTGEEWQDSEVRQALVEVHKAIKNSIGSKLLACNGVYEGTRFWQRYDAYVDVVLNSPLDGFGSEALWYQYQGTWMSEDQWLHSLEFLILVQDSFLKEANKFFGAICKIQADIPLPTACTREQMTSYAFASTLLGIKNSKNYFGITDDPVFMKDFLQPLHDLNLGEPLGDYYQIQGTHVYARDFSNVKVIVNPSERAFTVELNTRTINMQPHIGVGVDQKTGEILFRPVYSEFPLKLDLNLDGIINIIDLVIAAMAFSSSPGHQRWDPFADVNGDDIVDILDMALIAYARYSSVKI